MPKFYVYGDPDNKPHFSSSIIINALNEGARKAGLYDENGLAVSYDCIGKWHGKEPSAIIVCYELPFPNYVINQCAGKPIIGVSRDNMRFALDGGYNPELVSWIPLGVDTEKWKPIQKKYLLDKFVVLSYTESLCRSGLETLIDAFEFVFQNNKDAVLYIKDRNATPKFIEWIENRKKFVNIIYNNCHLDSVEQERDIFAHADCHFYLNRSTTWGMTACQSMAAGIPTVCPAYSGPREFIIDGFTGLNVDYKLVSVDEELWSLENIGMRNFFFPRRSKDYWARPIQQSVQDALMRLKYNHDNILHNSSRNGQIFAKTLSWENSARRLSEVLGKYY